MAESGENHAHVTYPMATDAKATDAKSDASQERTWETHGHFIGATLECPSCIEGGWMKQFEKCSAGPDETVSFFTIGIDETVSCF